MYILASLYQYYFLQTILRYIGFEKQIQQHFSKCESYLRERERERPAEREGARREFDVPPSLTDTMISGDSSLIQSAFKKTAHRHFCFGMAHCFELRLSKTVNYMIILWSTRKK